MAVSRMFMWLVLGRPTVHLWVLGLLKGFAKAKRFTALVQVTDDGAAKVCYCLIKGIFANAYVEYVF